MCNEWALVAHCNAGWNGLSEFLAYLAGSRRFSTVVLCCLSRDDNLFAQLDHFLCCCSLATTWNWILPISGNCARKPYHMLINAGELKGFLLFLGASPKERGAPLILWFGGGGNGGEGGEDISFLKNTLSIMSIVILLESLWSSLLLNNFGVVQE